MISRKELFPSSPITIHEQTVLALQEISATLVGTFEMDRLLKDVVVALKEISGASACAIFLVNEKSNKLVMRAGTGYERDLRGRAEYDLAVDPNQRIGLTAWIAITGKKFSAKSRQELQSHPAWQGKYDGHQYRGDDQCGSFIGVPLKVKNKIIGVLKAESKATEKIHDAPFFTPEEEQSFDILANTVAIAIENARLVEERQEGQSLLVNLYQLGAMLQEQTDQDRLLHIFLTGLTHGKVIGFNRAIFFDHEPLTQRLIGRMAIGPLNSIDAAGIRDELEKQGDALSVEACIRAFDQGQRPLGSALNRLASTIQLDIDKADPCWELVSPNSSAHALGEPVFREHRQSDFSGDIGAFLRQIDADESIMLIRIASSNNNYYLVLCDNIYDRKPFDSSTKELLPVFIGQMSRALDRMKSIESIKAARESAWQEVAAMAAHRLGNILPLVENRLDDALRNARIPPDIRQLLTPCIEDIKTAVGVLTDFRSFAGAGRVELTTVIAANSLLKRIEEELQNELAKKRPRAKIEIISYKISDDFNLRVDYSALKIVFLTLVTNSLEASLHKMDKITISGQLISDEDIAADPHLRRNAAKFVYEDNGPGIPVKDKSRIFEAFFTTKPGSTGLGLAIVQRIIEQHGGRIFENGLVGKGARFIIILPKVI